MWESLETPGSALLALPGGILNDDDLIAPKNGPQYSKPYDLP